MKKYVKKGVAFIGMRHLFDRNATPKQRNATPFLKKRMTKKAKNSRFELLF